MNVYEVATRTRKLLTDAPSCVQHADLINRNKTGLIVHAVTSGPQTLPKIVATLNADLWEQRVQTQILGWSDRTFILECLKSYRQLQQDGYEFDKEDLRLLQLVHSAYSVINIVTKMGFSTIDQFATQDLENEKSKFRARIAEITGAECRKFRPAGEKVEFCPKNTYGKRLLSRAEINLDTFEDHYRAMVSAIRHRGLIEFLQE
ncbi:hypothetical protein HN592_02230 [Candidatus Woesearchaeota archaeon]|jgi:hypothetical protein|nr:hypothetical protein [Candidatus Woesearchaeota archaeon]MBT4368030.1 hypothetical protein [Candidatus Woesearchaeota archaeon]MBT4712518.1 hypothetical protein [Candidatus Woesearchaeota archaeon]MBT6639431.1 hypothetical protein [Candidatus Woesearchaeota archaeon]MBT7133603.1 hypothetical protein [Candidatus Woesearchaeota archaeon]